MNMRRFRTSIAAAMGGALLVAGLLVGTSLALAQESDEPEVTQEDTTGDSLTRMFGYVQDTLEDESEPDEGAEDDLARISEQLRDDLLPLVDQIRELANSAIDTAVESGALTEEQAERVRERLESFALPERFPFLERGFRLGGRHDLDCFGFRFGPDGSESNEDCPEFEFPEGFPFGGDGFEFGPVRERLKLPEDFEMPEGFSFGPDGFEFGPLPEDFEFRFGPLERFGEDLEGFIDDLDIDLDELQELLESGMSLDEALQELGTDVESLLTDAREQALAKIDELVERGELSEEQADRIAELLEGIDLGALPFGLHRLDLDFGELPDLEGWGRGHGFFGPWDHSSEDEDLPSG